MLSSVAVLALLAAGQPADPPHGPPAPATDRNGYSLPPGAIARLGDHSRRHRFAPEWVAFSDDDRLLARPVDGVVQVFDLDQKQDATPGYLKDHPNAVLRFLPDGRHLLYSPVTKRIDVRDPVSGQPALGVELPAGAYGVDFGTSADGKRVLVKHRDPNGYSCALVADLTDRPPPARPFRGNSSSDQWVMSADGKRLFHGWDRGVAAYDATSGDRIAFAAARYRSYLPLVPTPDGGKLITGWDRGAVTFELTENGFGEPAQTHLENDDFAFAPDGKTVVRAGVGVYDAKGTLTAVEAGHDRGNVRTTRYSQSATRCVDLFSDRPPVVWDPHTGKVVYRFDQYAAAVGLGVTADGRVSVRHADRTVRVYTLDGKPVAERAGRANATTTPLGVSPDGTASVEFDGKLRKVYTFDTAGGKGVEWPQEFEEPPHTVRFDPVGRRVYLAGGGYAGVFDAGTGRRVRSAEPTAAAAFSDDGRTLAVIGKKELRVYELVSGKERLTADLPATDFDSQEDYRYSRRGWDGDDRDALPRGQVQFSADGGRVVLFWSTGRVTVFDTGDGGVRFREPRQWTATRYAAFRPDGEWFATTTRTQRRIALRNTADPRADRNAVILAECKSSVVGMAFAADGKRLISAHEDGTALVWDVESAMKFPPTADPDPGDTLWLALASADPKLAGKAVNGLVSRPDVAVPLLAELVRPETAPPADRVKAAVAALGDREFKVREAAEKQLRAWGDLAADELTAAEANANAEQGERIRRLLDALDGEETDGERLRLLRAVEVLERIGSPAAKAVLDKLGTGASASAVTREAKEAVKRLKERVK
jgi:WD40 repeat protein